MNNKLFRVCEPLPVMAVGNKIARTVRIYISRCWNLFKTEEEDPERPVLRCPKQYLSGYINYVVAIRQKALKSMKKPYRYLRLEVPKSYFKNYSVLPEKKKDDAKEENNISRLWNGYGTGTVSSSFAPVLGIGYVIFSCRFGSAPLTNGSGSGSNSGSYSFLQWL